MPLTDRQDDLLTAVALIEFTGHYEKANLELSEAVDGTESGQA